MGAREREKWDLPLGQGGALALLLLLFLAGGAAGGLFSGLAAGEGAQALCGYLTDYLTAARDGLAVSDRLSVFWSHLRWLLAAAVLGLTALGTVGIPVLFCVRGFLFAFSTGCLCRVFGAVGLLPALALFGLPALLWCPALFLAGFQGLTGASCLLRRGMGDARCPLPFSAAYWLRLGLCGALTVAAAAAECALAPALLWAAARAVL